MYLFASGKSERIDQISRRRALNDERGGGAVFGCSEIESSR